MIYPISKRRSWFFRIIFSLEFTTQNDENNYHSLPHMRKRMIIIFGTTGFEPATSCTPSKRATRLRHAPIFNKFLTHLPIFANRESFDEFLSAFELYLNPWAKPTLLMNVGHPQ